MYQSSAGLARRPALIVARCPLPASRFSRDALVGFVATDRVSAFDVVLPQAVPRKGEVLTLISAWWFGRTADLIPNHMVTVDPDRIIERYPALAARFR